MSLFQTKIRFLGLYISQGVITPIERSLDFSKQITEKNIDKTKLQRLFEYLCFRFLT